MTDLKTQIKNLVDGVATDIDNVIKEAKDLQKDYGIDVRNAASFRRAVARLSKFTGTTAGTASNAATAASGASSRLSDDARDKLRSIVIELIKAAGDNGLQIAKLKEGFNNDNFVKENDLQDKLQSIISGLKKKGDITFTAGKSKREGGTYKV